MAKDSDRLADSFRIEESGGTFSRLLAEEDEFDRRALWRLGSWAAVSVGAVIVAILASQSSIGMRRELTASADLVRQAQQLQLAARENLGETKRLASAVETLNGDRDRLYSRVAVLEQGLDSVTGTIARQNSAASPAQHSTASLVQAGTPPAPAAPATAAPAAISSGPPSSPAATTTASSAPVAPAALDPPAPPKPAMATAAPAPVAAPVAATAAAVTDKPAPKSTGPEPGSAQASASAPSQPAPPQPVALLVAPKSMMAPPEAAAAKLIEPAPPPKAVISTPIPEVTATVSKAPEHEAVSEEPSAAPELAVKRTEFGVDVGGANSIPGLRALWRGLLKSRANAALTTLHPIIVIKESSNGLGMQLRLVAGPISDAAAAAKICATLTVSDRSCTTAVFEGQRLALDPEEQAKADAKPAPETTPAPAEAARSAPKASFHKRYYVSRNAPKEEAPKPAEQPSTLSLIFGRH
jgi:hypothetical protein